MTRERLFSGVCSDVRGQALLALDPFATVGALVRSLPCVADHVLLQPTPGERGHVKMGVCRRKWEEPVWES